MQTASAATWASPRDNLLLAALSAAEYERMLPELELVSLSPGEFVAEGGRPLAYGYFPTTAIFAITTAIGEQLAEEVGAVGYEGMVGVLPFLAGAAHFRVAASAGCAYRARAEFLQKEFLESDDLRLLLLRYTQALMTQIAQNAVCNRHHRVVEQLCRWLLLRLDRSFGCSLRVTQQQIANLLGVRRAAITHAAHELHRAGIIHCRRGSIVVLDRAELERSACECYDLIRKEYARLVPPLRRRDPLRHNEPQQREYEGLRA